MEIIIKPNILFNGKVDDIKGIFKNGKEETWVRYYKNGQLFSVTNYKIGRKDGPWITYNNNGMILKRVIQNDLEEGLWIRFFENGEIKYKGEFKRRKVVFGLLTILMAN